MSRLAVHLCVFVALTSAAASGQTATRSAHAQLDCVSCHVPISQPSHSDPCSPSGPTQDSGVLRDVPRTDACIGCHDGAIAPVGVIGEKPKPAMGSHPVEVSYSASRLRLVPLVFANDKWSVAQTPFVLYDDPASSRHAVVRCGTCHLGHTGATEHNLRMAYDRDSVSFCCSCHIIGPR